MSDLRYDRTANEWVDKFGNRFVHQATFRRRGEWFDADDHLAEIARLR